MEIFINNQVGNKIMVEQLAKPKYKIKIRDLPLDERPRERLAKYGADALKTAVDIGHKLLKMYDSHFSELFTTDVNELSKIKGLGFVKAVQLKACLELVKRILEEIKGE